MRVLVVLLPQVAIPPRARHIENCETKRPLAERVYVETHGGRRLDRRPSPTPVPICALLLRRRRKARYGRQPGLSRS